MNKEVLSLCEQERLSLSGAIQPHGALLVLQDHRIVAASANLDAWLGESPSALLGQATPEILERYLATLNSRPGSRLCIDKAFTVNEQDLDLELTRGDEGQVICELTRSQEAPMFTAISPTPETGLALPGGVDNIDDRMAFRRQQLVEQIALLTGAHRVMYYAFQEDGDGEVLNEVCESEDLGSYLGLRFPAGDIPQVARALYLKNPWRMIPDITAKPVALLWPAGESTPDLSRSDLRSVSPMHLLYLKNMGVSASLSFPIVIGGHLHALVAIHHCTSMHLPNALLEDIALRTKVAGQQMGGDISQRRMRLIDGLQYRFRTVARLLRENDDPFVHWPQIADELRDEFKVDGAILCVDDEFLSCGLGFESEPLKVFDAWFCDQMSDFVWVCDSLSRAIKAFPLSQVAGVLAIRISSTRTLGGQLRGMRVYLTRSEHLQDVAWGGKPNKPVEYHDGQLGIAPRRSFAKWVEKRLGYARPWDNESRLLGLKLRELMLREQGHVDT